MILFWFANIKGFTFVTFVKFCFIWRNSFYKWSATPLKKEQIKDKKVEGKLIN